MNHKKPFYFATMALVLLAALARPSPALALFQITGVSPASVMNDVNTQINITGEDFDPAARVFIQGPVTTELAVNSVGPALIVASVPLGQAPGNYTVRVENPGPVSTTYGSLVVEAPVPATNTVPPPTSTNTPAPYGRPQIVIKSYKINTERVVYGKDFNLKVQFSNVGSQNAYSIQVAVSSSSLVPLKNGGVSAIRQLPAGHEAGVGQPMTASGVPGSSIVAVDMTVSYYDAAGTAYSDKFTINLPALGGGSGGGPYATATPTGLNRAQLVVDRYASDQDPLQPGVQFSLSLTVRNVGNMTAKGVTMIIGGGSASGSGGETPQAGGIAGGSGEFTNFAPVGSSNVQSLGDFGAGASLVATQKLIVNTTTNPGAYPMKVTFSYVDGRGSTVNDDQVITLLVYSLPKVEISFYQPVGSLFSGQPNMLPLQVVNLGKRTAVLGAIRVETPDGMIENGESLVGSLDPGGYYTLDAMVTPVMAGTIDIDVTIEYTDDFNQPRTITKTLSVPVEEIAVEEGGGDPSMGGGGGEEVPIEAESGLQKFWRFVLGLLGLDSAPPPDPGLTPPSEGDPGLEPNPSIPGPKGLLPFFEG